MAGLDGLTRQIETASLYFQGGVRRSVVVFSLVVVVIVFPVYLVGQTAAALWFKAPFNPAGFQEKNLIRPYQIDQTEYTLARTQFVPLQGDETILYTTINNRANQEIGYDPFVYRLQVVNNVGAIVDEKIVNTYLLPGEVKYIIAEPESTQGSRLIISPLPETQPVKYNPEADNLAKRVNVEVRNPAVSENLSQTKLIIQADIKNNDLVNLRELDLLYIIRDDRDKIVGIGSFKLENMKPYEERKFNLEYPKPKFRRATRLEIRPSINYLDSSQVTI